MTNEIEKTIEELEAEVLTELEEQSADAPKKGAAPAEPQLKASDASKVTPGGEVQDMGPAVTSPTDASGPGTQAGKKAKEASGAAAQKGEGKPDKIDTPNDGEKKVAKSLAAGDEVEMKDEFNSPLKHFANNVLPLPGGPSNITPFGVLTLNF